MSSPATESVDAWHAIAADEALSRLASTAQGLDASEAARRLARDGPNRLPEAPRRGALRRFLAQFHNLLIYVLLVAAAASLAMGHATDAAVIVLVVLVNAVFGFVQEGKAEQALAGIRRMIDPSASVLRNGRRITLPAEQLVRGDVVLLEAGDRVPADLRLLRTRGLRVDEAILTGESVAVDKTADAVDAEAALGDRGPIAHAGTLVVAGQGTGIVVEVAGATALGRVSRLLAGVEQLRTPLLAQMDRFARELTLAIVLVAVATLAFAIAVHGTKTAEAFMMVVGLAVAAIPEGLPAVLTITLAIGVQRMAARRAIVRRLPAVETLGSVSVICSDKTGTLTRNEMMVQRVATALGEAEVGGEGYAPQGGISGPLAALPPLAEAAVLCNDAALGERDGAWVVDGDPMEGALLAFGAKAGIDAERLRQAMPRLDEVPFDTRRRWMATLNRAGCGPARLLVKGAPERVLAMCSRLHTPTGPIALDTETWHARVEALAQRGLRVLALAMRELDPVPESLSAEDVGKELTLLGCVGLIDPPRAEAVEAVAQCRGAGIRVVMITGDHAATAGEIARQLGIAAAPVVRTGAMLDALDDAALAEALRATDVFARTTPEHKLRLVMALQAGGATVAMTGDGVNDAPALRRADVGVAMGRKGTEAAKQASEIVLADDNFASIVAAVREGRTVYDNLTKVIAWTLPTNGGEAGVMLVALLSGLLSPLTPVQILWINMITAVTLGLTLAFEPGEPGSMRRPPRPRTEPLLGAVLAQRVLLVALLVAGGAFGLFWWAETRALPIETARTLVVNGIVAMEIAYLIAARNAYGSSLTWRGLVATPAVRLGILIVVLVQAAFTYLPPLQHVLQAQALGATELAAVLLVATALLLAAEAEKWLRRRFAPAPGPGGG